MKEKKISFFTAVIVPLVQNAFRHYKRLFFPLIPSGYEKGDDAFLSVTGLFRLMLFSMALMAIAFLLVKAISILMLTGLLRLNHINHIYTIFNIYYLPGDESNWTDGALLVVYGIPNLIFLTGSMYLTGFIVRHRKLDWIFRLLLAWIAFQLMAYFLADLLIATFFYKGFGIALQWLVSNNILRIFIIVAGTIGLLYWSKRFGLMFLRCCPTRIFLNDPSIMRTWLIWVVLIPVISGPVLLLILLFFSLKINIAITFASALILLPLAFRSIDYLPVVRIQKSNKVIPGFIFILSVMIALGIVVRLLVLFV
ncbi:MAG: hypothetical protein V1775_12020 [Bacteroidota bacterium]